jgi:hypothetical protein
MQLQLDQVGCGQHTGYDMPVMRPTTIFYIPTSIFYIPTSVFDTTGLRFDEVKAIQFYVDDQLPSGDVHYKVFGLHFSRYN